MKNIGEIMCKEWKNVQCTNFPLCLGCNNCIASKEDAIRIANEYYSGSPYKIILKMTATNNNGSTPKTPFQSKVEEVINSLSLENISNTPDHILAKFLDKVFCAIQYLVNEREDWYGIHCQPGKQIMTLKTFIENFSHNNEVWVENKEHYCMYHKHYPKDINHDGVVMDWELLHTDIAECNVIKIANVIHEGKGQAITIVVDTDKTEFTVLPELVTLRNSPVWFYDRTHQTKSNIGE